MLKKWHILKRFAWSKNSYILQYLSFGVWFRMKFQKSMILKPLQYNRLSCNWSVVLPDPHAYCICLNTAGAGGLSHKNTNHSGQNHPLISWPATITYLLPSGTTVKRVSLRPWPMSSKDGQGHSLLIVFPWFYPLITHSGRIAYLGCKRIGGRLRT